MKKGTFTMFNNRVGPGSTSELGAIVGLGQAKKVSIFFQGSFRSIVGTAPQVQIFPAIAPFSGSVDIDAFGTMTLTGAANVSRRRIKYFEGLDSFPYIACKVIGASGTPGMNSLVKAVVQHD